MIQPCESGGFIHDLDVLPPLLDPSLEDDLIKPYCSHLPQDEIPWRMIEDSSTLSALLGKALQGTLQDTEEKKLLSELEQTETFPSHVIQMHQVMALIEKSVPIAVSLLSKALRSPLASEYYKLFTQLTPTINAFDIVKQLLELQILPNEIVELFLAHALDFTRSLHMDPPSQARLVRIICLFVQSILALYPYLLEDLAIELESFVVDYSHVKECADLFKRLKSQSLFI